MVSKLSEILDEEVDELCRRRIILGGVRPGIPWVEDRIIDARDRDRHFEAEIRVFAELNVVEAAVESGIEQCARFLDRHALADTILAAGPAGIDQPAVRATLGDTLLEQVPVD